MLAKTVFVVTENLGECVAESLRTEQSGKRSVDKTRESEIEEGSWLVVSARHSRERNRDHGHRSS